MKRVCIIFLIATFTAPLMAQDAVALAAQREQEENIKRLTATIQDVQEAQTKQKEEITRVYAEIERVRTEAAKANNNAATHDAMKKLSDEIEKVDKARVADNKKIYEALEQLKKLILDRPAPPPPIRSGVVAPAGDGGSSTVRPVPQANATEEGYTYTIQSGDQLVLIVREYQKQGIKVTMKQVMDANPNVKWERLKIGQKIFIPKPK